MIFEKEKAETHGGVGVETASYHDGWWRADNDLIANIYICVSRENGRATHDHVTW
jgi:hypothetical protein